MNEAVSALLMWEGGHPFGCSTQTFSSFSVSVCYPCPIWRFEKRSVIWLRKERRPETRVPPCGKSLALPFRMPLGRMKSVCGNRTVESYILLSLSYTSCSVPSLPHGLAYLKQALLLPPWCRARGAEMKRDEVICSGSGRRRLDLGGNSG